MDEIVVDMIHLLFQCYENPHSYEIVLEKQNGCALFDALLGSHYMLSRGFRVSCVAIPC